MKHKIILFALKTCNSSFIQTVKWKKYLEADYG